jgi:hypothetical protein
MFSLFSPPFGEFGAFASFSLASAPFAEVFGNLVT